MFNPDAYSDCMKQMGRRDPNEPPAPAIPHVYGTLVCPPCVKHEDQCWGGICECECNSTFAKLEENERDSQAGTR